MTKEYVEQIARLQEMTARQIVRTVHGSIGAERSHISLRLPCVHGTDFYPDDS